MSILLRTTIGTFGLLVLALPSALAVTQPNDTVEPLATEQAPGTSQGRIPPVADEQQRCRARFVPFSPIMIVEGPTTRREWEECLVTLRTREKVSLDFMRKFAAPL